MKRSKIQDIKEERFSLLGDTFFFAAAGAALGGMAIYGTANMDKMVITDELRAAHAQICAREGMSDASQMEDCQEQKAFGHKATTISLAALGGMGGFAISGLTLLTRRKLKDKLNALEHAPS